MRSSTDVSFQEVVVGRILAETRDGWTVSFPQLERIGLLMFSLASDAHLESVSFKRYLDQYHVD